MIYSKNINSVIIVGNDNPGDFRGPSLYMTSGATQYVAFHDWTMKELTDLRRVIQERIDVLAAREAKGCTHPESEACVEPFPVNDEFARTGNVHDY